MLIKCENQAWMIGRDGKSDEFALARATTKTTQSKHDHQLWRRLGSDISHDKKSGKVAMLDSIRPLGPTTASRPPEQ